MIGGLPRLFLTNEMVFSFDNFPHMDSNIPSKPAYGVYIFQVRIGDICDSYESFFTRHHQLTCRLVKQGFLYDKIVKGFCSRYPEIFSKFAVSIKKACRGLNLPSYWRASEQHVGA